MGNVLSFVIGGLCTAIAMALGRPWWIGALVGALIIAVAHLIRDG